MPSSNFYVPHRNDFLRINGNDISVIESVNRFCKIFISGKMHIAPLTISALEKKLKPEVFFRIHRSYIVQLAMIERITPDSVIVGDKEITIGRRIYQKLLSRLNILGTVRSLCKFRKS